MIFPDRFDNIISMVQNFGSKRYLEKIKTLFFFHRPFKMNNLSKYCCVITIMTITLLATSGCQPSGRDPYTPVLVGPQLVCGEILGYSVQNRPIELITLGNGPDTILIMATIHGDEGAGTPLVHRLFEQLRAGPAVLDGRTVYIMPVANPDGYVNDTRGNANGIDLNRNFPAENRVDNKLYGFGGLTEPESVILYDFIMTRRPTRIITLHQPLDCLDYDGPGKDLAEAMARYCPLPVKKLGSRPGSLGSFAGVELNIPIITMELTADDSTLSANQLWYKYGYALLAAITYPESP